MPSGESVWCACESWQSTEGSYFGPLFPTEGGVEGAQTEWAGQQGTSQAGAELK